jgi:molecular chaperone GrpE (heat shock protein)
MAINTIDFSNWPDWDDINWQESIYRSLSRKRDEKDQKDLTFTEKEILEALEKKGVKTFRRGCIFDDFYLEKK